MKEFPVKWKLLYCSTLLADNEQCKNHMKQFVGWSGLKMIQDKKHATATMENCYDLYNGFSPLQQNAKI